jgi:hypothetical protein
MAGSYIAGDTAAPVSIPVLFVRHGQSTNNPIYEGLYAQQGRGEITVVSGRDVWEQCNLPGLVASNNHDVDADANVLLLAGGAGRDVAEAP